MNELIQNLPDNFMLWVAGGFAILNFIKMIWTDVEWLFKKFGIETKGMREKREAAEQLAENKKDIAEIKTAIVEIKETSKRNVELFLEHEKAVVGHVDSMEESMSKSFSAEIGKLHEKLDAHKAESDETDQVMLRDRIDSGLRYFAQRADENGVVYVTEAEYTNMDALFKKYFDKDGNGTFEKAYETEFKKYKIDRLQVRA